MPVGLKGKTKTISVSLGDEARAAIEQLAHDRSTAKDKVYASDIVREALAEYLERRDIDVNMQVNRGGYRERKDN